MCIHTLTHMCAYAHCTHAPLQQTVKVGTRVTLLESRTAFQRALKYSSEIFYGGALQSGYDAATPRLLGRTVTVVQRPKAGVFGLPESNKNSGSLVWQYPFSVITCVQGSKP